ncbi:unnamed protein product [Macrosiphum euphorbiae]|uniref:Uncharacterized protein n=1 Tax=Macrosiphum euphorbiae TaxID=13131 RepID=A0AAV0Y9N1_9HEMI|nr:unnamed protein product [Macrosiphum euphorbiae]CAI6377659.1 unnamed protein product [Macrosiphum euphorbiae]
MLDNSVTSATVSTVTAEYGTHANSLRSQHRHGRTAQHQPVAYYVGHNTWAVTRSIPENTRRQQWFLDSRLFTNMAGIFLDVLRTISPIHI